MKQYLRFSRKAIAIAMSLALMCTWSSTQAQRSISTSLKVTEDFSGMSTSSLPANFTFARGTSGTTVATPSGTTVTQVQAAALTCTSSNGSWRFGQTSANYAAGLITSGSSGANTQPVYYDLYIRNTGAVAITQLKLTFNIKSYRENIRDATVTTLYSTTGAVNSWTSWTSNTLVGLVFPATCSAATSFTISTLATPTNTRTVSIAAGADYYVRFLIDGAIGGSGTNSQGIAIDDIEIDATSSCTPPTTQVSLFSASNPSTTGTNLAWTNGNGDRTLILGHSGSSTTFTGPVSGTGYTGNSVFSSATLLSGDRILFTGSGSSVSISGLTSGTQYTYIAYTYDNATSCYRTTGAVTATATTTSPNSDILTLGAEASAGISSLINTTPINANTDGTQTWSFSVRDGGSANITDSKPTIVTGLVINQGVSNTATSWSTSILAAALFDGTTKINGSVVINATNITFSGITNLSVTDGTSKTLTLRISLINPLPANYDNLTYQFLVNAAGLTTDVVANSSEKLASFSTNSDVTGTNNDIIVTATKLFFPVSNPTALNVSANATFTVQATDANNNIDRDNVSSVTLSKASGAGTLSAAGGLTRSLVAGTRTYTDVQNNTAGTFVLQAANGVITNATSPTITVTALAFQLFDDFNRTSSNTIGIPSSGGSTSWTEAEASNNDEQIVINSNTTLRMRNHNAANTLRNTGQERLVFDMTGKYPTTFNTTSSTMQWYFNMQTPRTSLFSFGSGQYAAAVCLGGTATNFYSVGNGYAVVMLTNPSNYIGVVRYTGGLNATNTIVCSLAVSNIIDFHSVGVRLNPCTNEWQIAVSSNVSFTDPTTVTGYTTAVVDATYTTTDLPYFGLLFNHSNGNSTNNRIDYDNIYIPNVSNTPTTYQWTGATTDYGLATNWSPNRTCQLSNDVLNFNPVASTFTVTNVPNQTIGQIIIPANKQITWVPARNTTNANRALVQITGGAGDDFTLDATSSLTINGQAAIAILLKSGATANIAGDMNFNNTTTNTGINSHRLLAVDANAWTFASGADITINRMLGSLFTSHGSSDTTSLPEYSSNGIANFGSGSSFTINDGSNPFERSQPNSKVNFLTGSTFDHRIPSTSPSFVGRTYGNLIVNNGGTLSQAQTNGTTLTILNNLTMRGNTALILNTTTTNAASINIGGNISIESGSSLTFNGGTTGILTVSLNGTSPQTFSNAGTFASNTTSTLRMNNSLGLSLLTNIDLQSRLDLSVGNVNLGNFNLKIYNYSNASNSSFVRTNGTGTLRQDMTVNTTLVFPVGVNPYMPIAINYLNSANLNTEVSVAAVDGITDEFGGNYTTNAVTTTWNVTTNGNIDDTRFTPGWDVLREGSTLTRNNVIVIYRTQPTQQWLRLYSSANNVPFNGAATDLGGGRYEFQSAKLDETIASGVTHFIGVMGNLSTLPVKLTAFNGKVVATDAKLNWNTAGELNNSHFDIERSQDGANFIKVAEIEGNGTTLNNKAYSFNDANAFAENNKMYYRLRQVDYNGKFEYSNIITLSTANRNAVANEVVVYPVPTTNVLNISGLSTVGNANINIVDMQGRIVASQQVTSSNVVTLDLSTVPAGMYYVRIISAEGNVINKVFTKK